jgi:hypothetical protein
MVDIGRDGTITVQKLEGSEKHFHAKSSHFMASRVPSSNVMKPTTAMGAGFARLELLGPFRYSPSTSAHTVRRTPVFPLRYRAPEDSSVQNFRLRVTDSQNASDERSHTL